MNLSHNLPLEKQHVAAMRRWRWLILVFGLLLTLTVELLEHESPDDPHFFREVFLYGLIVPWFAWLLFTLLAYQASRRVNAEVQLDQHRELSRQLKELQDWQELTRYVAAAPAATLPVDRVSLFIYEYTTTQLWFVAEWNALSVTDPLVNQYPASSSLCEDCLKSKSPQVRQVESCQFGASEHGLAGTNEYCQPLFYDGLLVGMRLLHCQTGTNLTPEQIEDLNATTPEIALALALALARRTQLDQTRAQAKSEERQRVATELHDTLGQMVSYLRFNLDRLSNDDRLRAFDDLKCDLARMLQVADRAYVEIRSDLWVMRSWKTPDVRQAITDYIKIVTRDAEVAVQLKIEGEPIPLEPRLAYQVFTLVREGLNNIVTHAQARRACIELNWTADCLRIQLIDDGVGFDPVLASPPGHYGLRMMRERVLAIGGTLLVDSSAEQGGTCLSLTLPIAHSSPVFADRIVD